MKQSLRNQKGFALTIILALLPVLIGGMLVVLFAMNYMKMNARHLYLCRSAHLEDQKQVAALLQQLLDLNPKAKDLREKRRLAEEALDAAMSSGQPYAIAVAQAGKTLVIGMQTVLDLQQRQLIGNSNRLLYQGHSSMQQQLRQTIKKDLASLKPFIKSSFELKSNSPPQLAVRPDKPDLAPVYNTYPDIEERQALAHQWQYSLDVAGFLETFLHGKQSFEKNCAVTVAKQGKKWNAKIHRVRSWSKWAW